MRIEEQELDQLRALQSKSTSIIMELGDISLSEIILQEKKDNIKKILSELRDEEKTIKEFLIQKYGDNIDINLENGEY